MDVTHTKQTNPWNCGSACLAMIANTTVAVIEKRFNRHPAKPNPKAVPFVGGKGNLGWASDEMNIALFMMGIRACCFIPNSCIPETTGPEPPADIEVRHVADDNLVALDIEDAFYYGTTSPFAIIAAVKRPTGSHHWVVVHNGLVYDPLEDKPFTLTDDRPIAICGWSLLVETRRHDGHNENSDAIKDPTLREEGGD